MKYCWIDKLLNPLTGVEGDFVGQAQILFVMASQVNIICLCVLVFCVCCCHYIIV